MKKLLTLFVVILFLVGCQSPPSTPELTVETFFDGVQEFNLMKVQSTLDQDEKDLESEFDFDFNFDLDTIDDLNYFNKVLKENLSLLEYTILNTNINEKQALVRVHVKYVDGSSVFAQTLIETSLRVMTQNVLPGDDVTEEEAQKILLEVLKDKIKAMETTFKERELDVHLKQTNKRWLITQPLDEVLNVVLFDLVKIIEELE